MGLFLQTAIIPDCSEDRVKNAIAAIAGEYPISNLIPDKCQYRTSERGVCILLNEDCIGYEELAGAMSKELGNAVLFLYIYDGDYWGYFLYDNGTEIDRFIPLTDYFEEVSEAEIQQMKGNADIIAKYFHVDKSSLEKYLVFWTEDMMEDYNAKAYEDDEFGQCEDWQMTDFMRKLGYPYEW